MSYNVDTARTPNDDMEYLFMFAKYFCSVVGPSLNGDSIIPRVLGGILDNVTSGMSRALEQYGVQAWWVWREAWRMMQGDYKRLPPSIVGEIDTIPGHFLHVSEADPHLVSYTPSEKHGREDRQVRTTLGRYLTRYQEQLGLSDTQLNRITREWSALSQTPNIVITNDEDEIVHIYRYGPSSCMSFGKVDNDPVRVYAGPDTAVAAWVVGSSVMKAEKILARSVVVPEDKKYVRAYSDDAEVRSKFEQALEDMGYSHDMEALDGKRLKLIGSRWGDSVVCPYVDGMESGEVNGEYLYVYRGDGGDLDVQCTSGFAESLGVACDCCGDMYSEDDLMAVDGGDQVCGSCLREHYTYAYTGYGEMEWVPNYDVYGYDSHGDAYTSRGARAYDLRFPEDDDETLRAEDDLIQTEDGKWYLDTDNLERDGYRRTIDDLWVQEDDSDYVETEDGEFVLYCDLGAYGYFEIDDDGDTRYVQREDLSDHGYELVDGAPVKKEEDTEDTEDAAGLKYQLCTLKPPKYKPRAQYQAVLALAPEPWVFGLDVPEANPQAPISVRPPRIAVPAASLVAVE